MGYRTNVCFPCPVLYVKAIAVTLEQQIPACDARFFISRQTNPPQGQLILLFILALFDLSPTSALLPPFHLQRPLLQFFQLKLFFKQRHLLLERKGSRRR